MKITKRIERIASASEEIFGSDPGSLQFLHSVLAQCSLPYREPRMKDGDKAVEYRVTNGRASVVLQSGYLADPKTGELVKQGLPFGTRPRLIMLHLCSEAIRRQSRVVPITDSMSGFIKLLGIGGGRVTGGKTGTITAFKEQLNRLAATRFQMIWSDGERATMMNSVPVSRFDVWFPKDHTQQTLWPSTIELSDDFFASLQAHALPLDTRAIKALQHNARALDGYAWLSHRLPRVRRSGGDLVSWKALHGQFGQGIKRQADFKTEFLTALRSVLAVYAKADIDEEEAGLRLHKSPPPVAALGR